MEAYWGNNYTVNVIRNCLQTPFSDPCVFNSEERGKGRPKIKLGGQTPCYRDYVVITTLPNFRAGP